MYYYPSVSLLITHYNRSSSLENLLQSFARLNCQFGEIVVSDDGSNPIHLDKLTKLQSSFEFELVASLENKGLGNNINKGQDRVTKKYTLYIQEDFEPCSVFPERLSDALSFMQNDPDLDYIRFYAYSRFPYLLPFKNGFSLMYIKPFAPNYRKIYNYSDHPHLRRTSFFSKFGRYAEGLKGDRTEYRMCISFIQNKGKGLFFDNFDQLFEQKNSHMEPSTMIRSSWRQSNILIVRVLRDVYRQIRYNYDIYMMRCYKRKV